MQSRRQRRSHAPARSVRPQARPADLRPQARPRATTPGVFPELGVQDETGTFGKLGYGDRGQTPPSGVVQHRTESPSMESTRNAYRDRIRSGSHVGAHYLIGQDGSTSLTVPTNKSVGHVRGNKDRDHRGDNRTMIGVENVGMATRLDRRGDLRQQVRDLDLSPAMKERLLALNDSQLKQTLRDTEYLVHTDITGAQKRANWNLVNRLSTEHGFSLDEVYAHEHVDYKTLGEAEPITEFLAARRRWPALLQSLRDKVARLRQDPSHDPAELQQLEAVLAEEESTNAALELDGTQAEKNAVDGERILGEPGPAQAREQRRVAFYEDFWARVKRIEGLTAE